MRTPFRSMVLFAAVMAGLGPTSAAAEDTPGPAPDPVLLASTPRDAGGGETTGTRLPAGSEARAVGQAANRNPLPIFIPCHRLVGAGGGWPLAEEPVTGSKTA